MASRLHGLLLSRHLRSAWGVSDLCAAAFSTSTSGSGAGSPADRSRLALLGAASALSASALLLAQPPAGVSKQATSGTPPPSSSSSPGSFVAAAAGKAAAAATAPQAASTGGDAGPVYSEEEVAQHRTLEARVWVTYADGVYDITDFIAIHPGGPSRIMLAAGGPIEPFWSLYQQHGKDEIRDLLEEYRIGRLAPPRPGQRRRDDAYASFADPYAHEPRRHPALLPVSQKPYNAETPPPLLTASHITPNPLFYVRNHMPNPPPVDAALYRLCIEGEGIAQPLELSLQDLRTKFKKHVVAATVQCTGNRRMQMKEVRESDRGS